MGSSGINSNSRVAMVNHKVATVNHKVATVNSNSRVVATPMIGFAAAVGTTTLPEGQNAISANNLEDRIQSWLNHLHSKVVMVNSKVVTVNSKAVMVNSKAATVTRVTVEECKHSTPMIGFAAAVGTTTLPEGRNAIGASSRKMRSMLGRLQIHKIQQHQ